MNTLVEPVRSQVHQFAAIRCRVLSAFCVAATLLLFAQLNQAQEEGPVAAWHLDENGGQVAGDLTMNGNNGQLGIDMNPGGDEADPAWIAPGRFDGSALRFSGDDFVVVPNASSLEPTNVTVEAWVRSLSPSSPGAFGHIVVKGAADCDGGSYALYTGASGGLQFYVSDGITTRVSPDALVDGGVDVWDAEWHHVAGTFDGATVDLWVDGIRIGGTPADGASIGYNLNQHNDIYLGTYQSPTCTLPFVGDIDEVRVWPRALTEDEIVENAQQQEECVAPQVYASFIPVGEVTKEGGLYEIDYGLLNADRVCDPTKTVGILICGWRWALVEPGQLVNIKWKYYDYSHWFFSRYLSYCCKMYLADDGVIEVEGRRVYLKVFSRNEAGWDCAWARPERPE